MELVGIETVAYLKATGEPVNGFSLHCVIDNAESVVGLKTEKLYISNRCPVYAKVPTLVLGMDIDVYYDQRRQPVELVIHSAPDPATSNISNQESRPEPAPPEQGD